MKKTINWGIIGLGKIAHKFAEGLAWVPDSQLVAVASRSTQKAKTFAEQYQVKHYHDHYEALAENPEVDVVYIATPHVLHYENTMMCLEHQKAVLCEKPFAMDKRQAQEMIELAKQQNLFLMEALWTKFLPSFQKVQTLLDTGVIGEIQSIQADFGFAAPFGDEHRVFNKALGGGALLDVGIYPLFLATTLLGKPQSLKAEATFGPTGADLHCGILLNYQQKMAFLSCSIATHQSLEANIFGESGTIKMSRPFHAPDTKIEVIQHLTDRQSINFETEGNGYNYEATEVVKCLQQGKTQSDLMTWQDSLFLMEMLDWVREEAGIEYD